MTPAGAASLAAAVLRHVAERPTTPALVDEQGVATTWAELGGRTAAVATALARTGVRADDRVAVLGGRTADAVEAVLGVLRAGATYCVLDPDLPPARRDVVLGDLDPAAVVVLDATEVPSLPVVRFADVVAGDTDTTTAAIDRSGPAYVMYTSGSTGHPKGVRVGDRAVLNMIASYDDLAPPGERLAGTLLARMGFDVSVWEVFAVLTRGGTLHVPAADVLVDGAVLWRELVERRVTSAYVAPALLESFTTAAEEHVGARPALDRLLIGVEPIPRSIPARLLRAVPGVRVVNGYGPTEATITATLHLCDAEGDPGGRVPIGSAVRGSVVDVVDEQLYPVEPGRVGEIVVSGECLAEGYVRPEDEVGRFVDGPRGRTYRTGDLARELPSGALEFVGRQDDQLKIDGYRLEPAELEHALAGLPGVRRSLALVTGGKRLVAVVEGEAAPSAATVRTHLAAVLPPHLLPARVLTVGRMPLTPNGKVDTSALLTADRARPVDGPVLRLPTSVVGRRVAEVCAEVLEVDVVGLDDDLYWLGATSVDFLRIAAALRARDVLDRTAGDVLQARTVRALVARGRDARPEARPASPGTYPTSRGQQGLWAWRELHPDSADTTVVHAVRWEERREPDLVRRALEAIVARHEALRTTFVTAEDGRPRQRVHAPGAVRVPSVPVPDVAAVTARIAELQEHRFEVRERAWSAELLLEDGACTLVLAADHLVMDGESAVVLERELESAYAAVADGRDPDTSPVPGPAGAAAAGGLDVADTAASRAYWDDVLRGVEDVTPLPEPVLACPGPRRKEHVRQELPAEVWDAVRALARVESTSPVVVVLAALGWVLSRRSGGPCLVSLAVSRRSARGLDDAIGHAVNLLPVPISSNDAETFRSHLMAVRDRTSRSLRHADLPFEEMVAHRHAGGPPVPRVVLSQHVLTPSQTGSVLLRPVDNAVHDLAVFLHEGQAGEPALLDWVWNASSTLPAAVRHCADTLLTALTTVVGDPGAALDAVPFLSPDELALIDRAAQAPGEPDPRTVVDLVTEHVARRPHAPAVQFDSGSVTYAQLDEHARDIQMALGGCLRDEPARVVAVVLEKSVDLVAALVGVLRAGDAYLPLDPAHAATRLPELVATGQVDVCVTRAELVGTHLPEVAGLRLILVGTPPPDGASARCRAPGSEDLAYVMPTSGSTGRPHLVGVPHRAVVRLVRDNAAFPLGPADRTMLIANTSFDAATFEIWGALANGGAVTVAAPEDLRDPHRLCRAVERAGVTAAFFTVTLFGRLLAAEPERLRGVRHLLVGGEALPPRLVDDALEHVGPGVLVNGYGPTENTTFSCCHRVDGPAGHLRSLPIGTPISGSGVLVLDDALRPVPVGLPGEIVVTGAGLALGYLDDPDLTAQRFVTLPDRPSTTAYRTGDRGRLLPDGTVEYLGRSDRQLKVRGFRVEPAELEVALERHPDVRRAVAFGDDAPEGRRLLAAVESPSADGAALRKWLRDRVPPYLLPGRVIVVDQFPSTPNGKLDTAALVVRGRTTTSGAPSGGTEALDEHGDDLVRTVLAVWQEALAVDHLRTDADVFDLGANSMTVLAVTARLAAALGRSVPAHLVYSCPTVQTLASRLADAPEAPSTRAVAGGRERALARAAKVRAGGRRRR